MAAASFTPTPKYPQVRALRLWRQDCGDKAHAGPQQEHADQICIERHRRGQARLSQDAAAGEDEGQAGPGIQHKTQDGEDAQHRQIV